VFESHGYFLALSFLAQIAQKKPNMWAILVQLTHSKKLSSQEVLFELFGVELSKSLWLLLQTPPKFLPIDCISPLKECGMLRSRGDSMISIFQSI
jgi:hypothetical protein